MRIYKLEIDTSKPTRKVLNVPCVGEKYGLAVKATADGCQIASPYCSIIDNGTTLSATKTLEDGSFLFEMAANAGDGEREIMVYVINTDELSDSQWDGNQHTYFVHGDDLSNTELNYVFRAAAIWYQKSDGTYFADDELITFTAETHIGHSVAKKIGNRVKTVYEDICVVPAGKYYPRELDRAVLGGSVGLPANCKVKVVLRPSTKATPETVLDEPNTCVTIDGVDYVPTTITVDGIEYVVLAAIPNATETTEPANSDDSNLTSGE